MSTSYRELLGHRARSRTFDPREPDDLTSATSAPSGGAGGPEHPAGPVDTEPAVTDPAV